MKWLKITVVFFLVTLVKCGPTRNEEDLDPEAEPVSPVEAKITRIERTGRGTTLSATKDTFLFTFGGSNIDVNRYSLEVSADNVTEHPVTTNNSTLSFSISLADYYGKDSNFLIKGYSDSDELVLFSKNDINPFPTLPDDLQGVKLQDPLNPDNDFILRVEGNLESMEFSDLVLKKIVEDTKTDTRYYNVLTDSAKYSLCKTVDSYGLPTQEPVSHIRWGNLKRTNVDSVDVCDNLPVETVVSTQGEILTSATLSYGPPESGTATVKLEIDAISGNIPVYEAILIPSGTKVSALCTTTECPIGWSNPSDNTLQLMIIRKTPDSGPSNKDSWTTSSVVIHDRELIATSLGSDILEGRWNIHNGESIYQMVKTDTTTKNEETKIVDCSDLSLDPKVCFGYFPHMPDGTYTLTVAYQITDGSYNKTDKIESSPVPFSQAPSTHELGILSRHTTRHANQLTADVNICFQHLTPQEGGAFSHYEMLIINEKGQWLKHRILEEEEEEGEGEGEEVSEGRLCFAPFTINTKDFDLTEGTKVVISQRGVDGFTVLATGESKLL